jgi:hypothetical protein
LNCGDSGVPINVKVVPPDPHRLDGDKDGVGCEGSGSSSGGGNGNGDGGGSTSASECQGQADCFRGTVTEIVDGDTLDVNNVRVRLALVNTPERGENGYTEAIDFVQSVCSVGTTALVDEDDGQKEGSFDRVIGLVYCGNDNINNKKPLNARCEQKSWRGYEDRDGKPITWGGRLFLMKTPYRPSTNKHWFVYYTKDINKYDLKPSSVDFIVIF